MKKHLVAIVCFAALIVFAASSYAEYDRETVVEAMRAAGPAIGAAKEAVSRGDFYAAAEKLMNVAKAFKSIDAVVPRKKNKAGWNGNHGRIIKAAFRGIGACADEDAKVVSESIAEILKLKSEGHKMFR